MNSEKSFETSMSRLNELVAILEKNDTSLDETIACFEEGLKLVSELEKQLKSYENKVNDLLKAGADDAE